MFKKVDQALLAQLNNNQLLFGKGAPYKAFVAAHLSELITNWPTIWAMTSQVSRGKLIEEILAHTDFRKWNNIGHQKGGTVKLVDFYHNSGILSQVKSTNSTLESTIKNNINQFGKVIDKLADAINSKMFHASTGQIFPVINAQFDLVIPKGFKESHYQNLVEYGFIKGVLVNFIEK